MSMQKDIRNYFGCGSSHVLKRIPLSQASWIEHGYLPRDLPIDFEEAWHEHPHERGSIRIGGNIIQTPRWIQSYLRPYYFSGAWHDANDLPRVFLPVLEWARQYLAQHLQISTYTFDQVLVNWYKDGHDYIGPHSDAVDELIPCAPILSISLGQERTFRLKYKNNQDNMYKPLDICVNDRSFIVMGGKCQDEYTHEVPKVTGKKGDGYGRRINITLRCFLHKNPYKV